MDMITVFFRAVLCFIACKIYWLSLKDCGSLVEGDAAYLQLLPGRSGGEAFLCITLIHYDFPFFAVFRTQRKT